MNFFNRVSTKIVILSLIVGSLFFSNQVFAALNQTNFNNQKKSLDQDISAINKQIADITGSLEDASKLKSTLKEQEAQTEIDIAIITNLIIKTEDVVVRLDKEVADNKRNIANLEGQMKLVLREIQKNQKVSPIQKLISSENFGDAVGKLYALSSTQNTANELKNQLQESLDEQEVNLAKQKQTQEDLNSSKALLEGKKGYLINLIANYKGKEDQYAAEIAKLQADQKISEAEAAKLQADWEKEKARLAEEARRNRPTTPRPPTSGGGGSTPNPSFVPGNCYFEDAGNPGVPSGFFGSPVGSPRLLQNFTCSHDALDIGGSPGTPLIATAAGVIQTKGSFNVYGYGNWVMIKHTLPNGNRIYSLYAHMQSGSPLAVGSSVSKGQTVGSMGCTGSCRGTHVHFMLYSQSYESNGLGCRLGSSKCFNPRRFINI